MSRITAKDVFINDLNMLHKVCKEEVISNVSAKKAFQAYSDLQLSGQRSQDIPPMQQYIKDTVLVILNQAVLQLAEIPKVDCLKFYHRFFAWSQEFIKTSATQKIISALESKQEFNDCDHSVTMLEKYIPANLRKTLGEHWTPAPVVDFIIRYTISEYFGSTLDPAVGGGAFMLGWLRRYCKLGCPGNSSFTGYDINPTSLAIAGLNLFAFQQRFPETQKARIELEYKDSLKVYSKESAFSNLFSTSSNLDQYNYVVGNPPYVRVQNIQPVSLRESYRLNYPQSATGHFDLYMLFIELAERALKDGGKLGYIVSNKILTSNAARGIRKLLRDRFSITNVVDLADSKLFQAAILPIILIAEKKQPQTTALRYTIVRETPKEGRVQSIKKPMIEYLSEIHQRSGHFETVIQTNQFDKLRSLAIESFDAPLQTKSSNPWFFTNSIDRNIIKSLEGNMTPLSDHCITISAGIKTTADDIFCNPITEEFVKERKLERGFIKSYLQGSNIRRWQILWSGTKPKTDTYLIYPHQEINGKTLPVNLKNLPNIAKWFSEPENRKQLASRTYVHTAGRLWYEIWVPQKPHYFEANFKIVTPDFSTHNAFALDMDKRWCGGSAFMIIPKVQERKWSLYLLGIFNSDVIEYYHKLALSTFIYAGRYRYTASALKRYPIPIVTPTVLNKIAKCADRLLTDYKDFETEKQLNIEVAEAFRLSEGDLAVIQKRLCR